MSNHKTPLGQILAVLGICLLANTRGSTQSARYVPAARGGDRTFAKSRIRESYGSLPLSFEENRGQAAPSVDFLVRGSGYSVFLTATEAVLAMRHSAQEQPGAADDLPQLTPRPGQSHPPMVQEDVVRLQLVGSSTNIRAEGLDALPGKANYFIGNDRKQWRSGVPTFARVRYENVYPGIDLVYYGNRRQLEYDFIVAPGADAASIALAVSGASAVDVDGQGNLILQSGSSRILQRAPRVYQEFGGAKRYIQGRYVLQTSTSSPVSDGVVPDRRYVRFEVGRYDRRRPLVIDPALDFSTYLGGARFDGANAIAVDSGGNAYVTGYTYSTDFPTVSAAFGTAPGGTIDVFVTKLDPNGASLVYSTYLGGTASYDYGYGIAVDSAGCAYVTGHTFSSDFPTTAGAFETTFGGTRDSFVTKLDASGAALVYSTFLGGAADDYGAAIAVDTGGQAYVTGYTQSANFPTTAGAFDTTLGGAEDAFVTKLNAGGTSLVYSTLLGGAANDEGYGIAVDGGGYAYVTGLTRSTAFPTSAGAFDTTFSGPWDAFVTRVAPTGAALAYSTFLGGSGANGDIGQAIAVDGGGNAYVTGITSSSDFPTTAGAVDTTYNGGYDAFVTKVAPGGTALVYSTYLGGTNFDSGYAIALDSAGDAYVTGYTISSDFPTTPGSFATAFAGGYDVFVTKIAASGATLAYSSYLGGLSYDVAQGIAVDGAGNAYVTGRTFSANFPTTPGAFATTISGDYDAFVTKLARPGTPDLVETALDNPPAVVVLKGQFSISDTVQNQGSGAAGASTSRYYLSVDTVKSGNDKRFGAKRSVPALVGGAASTGTAKLTVAVSTKVGVYYLIACADDLGVVSELDETNNCRTSGTTVEVRAPDLVETAVSDPPPTAPRGGSFAVTDTVQNKGNAAAGTSTTRYYLSLDAKKSGTDALLAGTRAVPGLSASGTSTGSVTVTIPSSLAPATYYLLACSDDLKKVAESNEKNNCLAASARVSVTP